MTTAVQWQQSEIERLTNAFAETGKAKRIYEPPRKLFVSEEEYKLALTMRVKLCDKPNHTGERVMVCNDENFYYEKGAPIHCKSCKMGKSRQVTTSKRKERMVVYATAEDWFANVAHEMTQDGKSIGSCRLPIKDEFTEETEYEKAKRMRQERYREFQRQYHARRDIRDKDNAYHREEYANMSAGAKKQKTDRDQTNKDARKATALENGMCWCPFGSHAVEPSEMMFCPKTDLNIQDFKGHVGELRRDVCKAHYAAWLCQDRSFKQKYRNDLSLRIRFRLEWFQHSAKRYGKTILLTEDEQNDMVTSACMYCDQAPTDERPNSIDMLDAMCTEYRNDTCVPSCHRCNFAKGGMFPQDYIQKCNEVTAFQTNQIRATKYIAYRQIYGRAPDQSGKTRVAKLYYGADTYKMYKYQANPSRRNLEFAISNDEFNKMKQDGCFYCGLRIPLFIGIDRIDSSKGYTRENTCGCCTTCNMMKKKTSATEFVHKCAEVTRNVGM